MRKLLFLLALLSASIIQAGTGDIKHWKNGHDMYVTYYPDENDALNCTLEMIVLYHHNNNDDGFRSDEGGGLITIDGVNYFRLKCDERGYKVWIDKINSSNQMEYTSDLNYRRWQGPLEDIHGCNAPHFCYAKFIFKVPYSMLNRTIKTKVEGTWWRWGAWWDDDAKTEKEISLPYTIRPAELTPEDIIYNENTEEVMCKFKYDAGNAPSKMSVKVDWEVGENSFTGDYIASNTAYFQRYFLTSLPVFTNGREYKISTTTTADADQAVTPVDTSMTYYGFPKPIDLTHEYSFESHSVTLNWGVSGHIAPYSQNGSWVIVRCDDTDQTYKTTELGRVGLDVTTYTDPDFVYNHKYTYTVYYAHNSWKKSTLCDDLSASTGSISTTSNPALTVTAEGQENQVDVNIGFTASETEGFYTIEVYRDSEAQLLKTFKKVAAGTSSLTYSDVYDADTNPLNHKVPHKYIVKLYQNSPSLYAGNLLAKGSATAAVNTYTKISDFKVTAGTFTNRIKLSWNAARNSSDLTQDYYAIYRKEASQEDSEYELLSRKSSRDVYNTYEDLTALPGVPYTYKLAVLDETGELGSNVSENIADGYAINTGTITGRLTYADGTALAGATVTAEARSTSNNALPATLRINTGASLTATTDNNGNYVISDIPYEGEGTTYAVIPTYGAHNFGPAETTCYITSTSLAHQKVNFTDKSSYKVSGTVTYQYGNYPVEGAKILVDGVEAMRNGLNVTTDQNGEYWVEVPVGNHFLTVEQEGHTYVNNGRFPASYGAYYNFKENTKDVDFQDATLITIRGRVAGGQAQASLPVDAGWSGGSRANIGQATLRLSPVSNRSYALNNTSDNRIVMPSADATVDSHTYLLPHNSSEGIGQAQVEIVTDSLTGEFCAQLPPISYQVLSGSTKSVTNDMLRANEASQINPIIGEESTLVLCYEASPIVTITDSQHENGAFGDSLVDVSGAKFPMFKIEGDKINYTLGYPVLQSGTTQRFNMAAYQEYINADKEDADTTRIPLSGAVLSFQNGNISDSQTEADNLVTLDEQGKGYYRFVVGDPLNDTETYAREFQAKCTLSGRTYSYPEEPMRFIIMGFDVSSGKGFFSEGPDVVTFVLRDPPGSESSSTLEEGSTWTTTVKATSTSGSTTQNAFTAFEGIKWSGKEGAPVVYHHSIKVGVGETSTTTWKDSYTDLNTVVTKGTTTSTISTGGDVNNVGARGDVFVGRTTLHFYGKGYRVGLVTAKPADTDETVVKTIINSDGVQAWLCTREEFAMGNSFSSGFQYTQHYITDDLIPAIKEYRNSLILAKGTDTDNYQWNDTVAFIYISKVDADDPTFGQANTYDRKANTNKTVDGIDEVQMCNTYIDAWEAQLAANEKEKVEATYNRNLSLTSGSTITEAYTQSSTKNVNTTNFRTEDYITLAGFEGVFAETVDVEATNKAGSGYNKKREGLTGVSEASSLKLSYTLKDNDPFDNFTVSVADTLSGNGLFFHLQNGSTTRPWEGPETTKYYCAGQYRLSEGTAAVQKPSIRFDQPTLTDVPSGTEAIMTAYLTNQSEIGATQVFYLDVVDGSNPNGLVITLDGLPIGGTRRSITLPAGQTVPITLSLTQTSTDVLDYDDITLRLYGNNVQVFEMSDPTLVSSATFSVHYKASSSPVTLATKNTSGEDISTLNVASGSKLRLEATDFVKNYTGLIKIGLQRRGEADTQWSTVHEWALNDSIAKADNIEDVVGDLNTLTYDYDMHAMADGTYQFQAITYARYGTDMNERTSSQLTVVKDMNPPVLMGQPSPAGGILMNDGEISLTFNEPIYASRLTNADISVQSVLNTQQVEHSTGLHFTGGDGLSSETPLTLSAASGITVEAWTLPTEATRSTLFRHSPDDNAFQFGYTAAGNIWVKYMQKEYVTPTAVQSPDWQYVAVGIDGNNLFVYDFYNDNQGKGQTLEWTTALSEDEEQAALSNGNVRGRIFVGDTLVGNMSHLAVWDKARTLAEISSDKSIGKTGRETGLVGYWPMTECHGSVAADKVYNHDIQVPSEVNWYVSDVNYALTGSVDGIQTYAADKVISAENDFCLEMWFNVSGGYAGSSSYCNQLFQAGNMCMDVVGGEPILKIGDTEYDITSATVENDEWHHLAMNVRRGASVTFLLDGKVVNTLSPTIIGEVACDSFYLAKHLRGYIDEVRLWRATLSNNAIKENMYARIDSTTSGLLGYWPMEKKQLIQGTGVWETVPTVENYTLAAPTLAPVRTKTSVSHTWVASDEKIVIKLTELPYLTEGCTLEFSVANVADHNGNEMQDPVRWTAYANTNCLKWTSEQEITQSKPVFEYTYFLGTFTNNGSTTENWQLTNLPSWLEIEETSGTLEPQQSQTLLFIMPEGVPSGTYDCTIGLMGNNAISEPLHVSITRTGEEPEWSVDPTKYAYSCTLVGQLNIDGYISEDSNDLLAAFIDGKCVGVASPQYYSTLNRYIFMMNIYGDNYASEKPVTFRVWDASTGLIYPNVGMHNYSGDTLDVAFTDFKVWGTPTAPVTAKVGDFVEQTMKLGQGWNWTSLNVVPVDGKQTVSDIYGEAAASIAIIKSQTAYAEFDQRGNNWKGTLTGNLDDTKMYMVRCDAADTTHVSGDILAYKNRSITLQKGWNWIGYTPFENMSLSAALSGLDANEGDVIKSTTAFAQYTTAGWVGTLSYLQPGVGYAYYNSGDATTFVYPRRYSAVYRADDKEINARAEQIAPAQVRAIAHPTNMTTVLQVMIDGEAITSGTITALNTDGIQLGSATLSDDGKAFLTLSAEEGEPVLLRWEDADTEAFYANAPFCFQSDAIKGSMSSPLQIDFKGDATSITSLKTASVDKSIFDLSGRQLEREPSQRGIYVRQGKKVVK